MRSVHIDDLIDRAILCGIVVQRAMEVEEGKSSRGDPGGIARLQAGRASGGVSSMRPRQIGMSRGFRVGDGY